MKINTDKNIRKARISDIEKIHSLINLWAKEGKLLNRPINSLYENIRDFWIYTEKKTIIGCCAIHIAGWQNLGEIKSLAVSKKYLRRKIGTKLVEKCIEEAKELGIKKIFALTFAVAFFKKLGFKKISRKILPHKIWSDCVHCIYFPNCKEKAVMKKL